MLIATIVFGPFAGAAAAAVIGKKSEKAGEYAALFNVQAKYYQEAAEEVRA